MGFGNDFLDMAHKAQVTESKLNKWDHIKLKCFCTHTHTQETFNEIKKKPQEWEKVFSNHVSEKRLTAKIYKELIQLNSTKQIIQLKMGKRSEQTFAKEDMA